MLPSCKTHSCHLTAEIIPIQGYCFSCFAVSLLLVCDSEALFKLGKVCQVPLLKNRVMVTVTNYIHKKQADLPQAVWNSQHIQGKLTRDHPCSPSSVLTTLLREVKSVPMILKHYIQTNGRMVDFTSSYNVLFSFPCSESVPIVCIYLFLLIATEVLTQVP